MEWKVVSNVVWAVWLLYLGCQSVNTKSLLVSQDGLDMTDCGNWQRPCRTVKYAVTLSDSGDELLIDHAQRKPYEECSNFPYSTPAIQLNKSLSFTGFNGTAVLHCRRGAELFSIQSAILNPIKIAISEIELSHSDTLVRFEKDSRFQLSLRSCVFTDYRTAVVAKLATSCSFRIFNSTFKGHTYSAITTSCRNLAAQFEGSTFLASPVELRTIFDNTNESLQLIEVSVSRCTFFGLKKQMCRHLLKISSSSVIVNISVQFSMFRDHKGDCPGSRVSTLDIYGSFFRKRTQTVIHINKLTFENNNCTGAMIHLIPIYIKGTVFKVGIMNSLFKNTTTALSIQFRGKRRRISGPRLMLSNNTFLRIFQTSLSFWPNQLLLGNGNYLISSCKFIDNNVGNKPYDAVIRVSYRLPVVVRLNNCYFENSLETSKATQIFAGNWHKLFFYENNTFNVTRLHKECRILTFMTNEPSGGARNLRLLGNLKVFCPYGYVIASNQNCQEATNMKYIECSYYSVSCKPCPRNTYSITRAIQDNNITNQIQCHDCVNGGQCFQGQLTARPNFWGYKTDKTVRFLQCPRGYCCDMDDCESYDSCYGNRTGTLCGHCSQGMSESLLTTECVSNGNCGNPVVWPIALSVCAAYLLFFLYHQEIITFIKKIACLSRRKEENPNGSLDVEPTFNHPKRSGGLIKILFYYYQVVHLIRNSNSSQMSETFVDRIENMVSKIFTFIVMNVSSLACPLSNNRTVEKQVILHSLGYVLLALLALLYLITMSVLALKRLKRHNTQTMDIHCNFTNITRRRNKPSSFTSHIFSAFTYISLLMYASSAQLCLSLLHCVPVGDNQVLFLNGNIKCYQTFQYFLLAYLISSILPFCLVPVLGSYLLKFGEIGVKQFCVACIFPLPFCCFWIYLLLKEWIYQKKYDSLERDVGIAVQRESFVQTLGTEFGGTIEEDVNENASSILRVLLGPFRDHKSQKWFPGCPIPWEGFLTFRKLALIFVLTFVYDNRLKMIVVLTLCLVILISHIYVQPFQSLRDNALETVSLGVHIVLCGLTMIRMSCYGDEVSFSGNLSLLNTLNLLEKLLVGLPVAITTFAVIFSLLVRVIVGFLYCVRILCRVLVMLFFRQPN